jgi:hypothetical protein
VKDEGGGGGGGPGQGTGAIHGSHAWERRTGSCSLGREQSKEPWTAACSSIACMGLAGSHAFHAGDHVLSQGALQTPTAAPASAMAAPRTSGRPRRAAASQPTA